jgi:hypothetical protein
MNTPPAVEAPDNPPAETTSSTVSRLIRRVHMFTALFLAPWPSPWDKAVPKPEVYFDQIDPDVQGNAVLWYRSREEADRGSRVLWMAA